MAIEISLLQRNNERSKILSYIVTFESNNQHNISADCIHENNVEFTRFLINIFLRIIKILHTYICLVIMLSYVGQKCEEVL